MMLGVHKAETGESPSAGDCLPALMMAGKRPVSYIEANHGGSARIERGASLQRG